MFKRHLIDKNRVFFFNFPFPLNIDVVVHKMRCKPGWKCLPSFRFPWGFFKQKVGYIKRGKKNMQFMLGSAKG